MHLCQPLSAVQVLLETFKGQATLLVLDNVNVDTAPAAVPLLAQRHAGSLVLATAWNKDAIQALAQAAIHSGQLQLPHFDPLMMHSSLVLTQDEATELIKGQMAASMETALTPAAAMTNDQLDSYASQAARALSFSHAPQYVPKVLSVCACALGMSSQPTADGLPHLLSQLHDAREPRLLGVPLAQSRERTIFGQLTACFEQLEPLAKQLWLAVVQAGQLELDFQLKFHDEPGSLLWLQCHAPPDTSMDEIQQQVSPSCLNADAAHVQVLTQVWPCR